MQDFIILGVSRVKLNKVLNMSRSGYRIWGQNTGSLFFPTSTCKIDGNIPYPAEPVDDLPRNST